MICLPLAGKHSFLSELEPVRPAHVDRDLEALQAGRHQRLQGIQAALLAGVVRGQLTEVLEVSADGRRPRRVGLE